MATAHAWEIFYALQMSRPIIILFVCVSKSDEKANTRNVNMASPPSPPAVQSIGKLAHEMVLSFKYDATDISVRLWSRGLISDDTQERILFVSNYTPTDKAAILVKAVKDTMRRSPESFEDLLDVLSECSDTIVSVEKDLRSTYQS